MLNGGQVREKSVLVPAVFPPFLFSSFVHSFLRSFVHSYPESRKPQRGRGTRQQHARFLHTSYFPPLVYTCRDNHHGPATAIPSIPPHLLILSPRIHPPQHMYKYLRHKPIKTLNPRPPRPRRHPS